MLFLFSWYLFLVYEFANILARFIVTNIENPSTQLYVINSDIIHFITRPLNSKATDDSDSLI
jgi:hypothetical protein